MTTINRRSFVKLSAVALAGGALTTLAGCGSTDSGSTGSDGGSSSGSTKIVVGASPSPHAEILAQAEDALADAGYELEIVEYSDYIQPNVALNDGDLDANYFQHQPYLDNYNEENGTDLVGAEPIHYEPMGIWSNKHDSLDDIPDGAQIAVPSDATNEARALLLLEANGFLTLEEGAGLSATAENIADNPHNIELVETEAANIARSLDDVDFGVINGNYALSSGLVDEGDPLASETTDSEAAQTYANVIACRNGDEDSDKIKALIDAIETDEVKQFIEDTYKGTVVAVF